MSTTTTVITEPSAVLSGAGVYLLARLLRAAPVTNYIRTATWLHGDDFGHAVHAIHAAGDAWQATINVPQRHNDGRDERPEQHCGTLTLTVEQVAEQLHLGPRQVQRLAQAGRLDGHRAGGRWQLYPASIAAYEHQKKRTA